MIIVLILVIVDSVEYFIASRSGPTHWLLPGDGESSPLLRSTDVSGRLSPCRGLHSASGYGPPEQGKSAQLWAWECTCMFDREREREREREGERERDGEGEGERGGGEGERGRGGEGERGRGGEGEGRGGNLRTFQFSCLR